MSTKTDDIGFTRGLGNRKRYLFFAALAVIYIAFSVFVKGFFSWTALGNILVEISIPSLVSLGLTFVIISGNWDLSFGSVAGIASMTTCYVTSITGNMFLGILSGLMVALLAGIVNGAFVSYFGLSDVIITIGTGSIYFGLSYLYSGGYHIHENLGDSFGFLYAGSVGPFPVPTILLGAICLGAYITFNRAKIGRAFYSTGLARTAAIFSGVNTEFCKMLAFVICGLLAGIGGILTASENKSAWVLIGQDYLLTDYAIVFLGWAIFDKPSVIGTLVGAFFLGTISTGFVMAGVPFYVRNLGTGALLLIAITIGAERQES
jgi:ribose transport system permease protein